VQQVAKHAFYPVFSQHLKEQGTLYRGRSLILLRRSEREKSAAGQIQPRV
jgi:hypothetical protein